jgi:hypothetical protein
MRLIKRYFDLIAPDGEFLIAYDAAARLSVGSVRYRALLSSIPALARRRVTLEGAVAPADRFPEALRFRDALAWRVGRSEPPHGVEARAGPIAWRLDSIGAPVQVACAGALIEGAGYSETVKLDVAPWRIGVTRVRWGRFVGERHWGVWNVVEGEWPLAIGALDGAVCREPVAGEDRVELGAGRIELGASVRAVHSGDVLDAELSSLAPLIKAMAGAGFALIQEKHVRAARLEAERGIFEEGLAMDESVRIRVQRRAVERPHMAAR